MNSNYNDSDINVINKEVIVPIYQPKLGDNNVGDGRYILKTLSNVKINDINYQLERKITMKRYLKMIIPKGVDMVIKYLTTISS